MIAAGRLGADELENVSSFAVLAEGRSVARTLRVDDVLLAGGAGVAVDAGGDAIASGRLATCREEAVAAALGYAKNAEEVEDAAVGRYADVLGSVVGAVAAVYGRPRHACRA